MSSNVLHQRSQAAEWDTRAAERVCRWHTRVTHIKDPKQQNGIPEQQNGYVEATAWSQAAEWEAQCHQVRIVPVVIKYTKYPLSSINTITISINVSIVHQTFKLTIKQSQSTITIQIDQQHPNWPLTIPNWPNWPSMSNQSSQLINKNVHLEMDPPRGWHRRLYIGCTIG
jgi:hypothetical protein